MKYEYIKPSYEPVSRPERSALRGYPSQTRYSLEDGVWRSHAEDKDEVSILVAGDLMCQENMVKAYELEDGSYDFTLCFDYMRPFLLSADLSIGNLETVISETAPYRGEIVTHEGSLYCNAPIEYLGALKYAGFDMLTTANNHILDAGARGLVDTGENVESLDIIHTGTFSKECDKFVIVDCCGFKIGFVAFATGYNAMERNLSKEGRAFYLNTYSKESAKAIIDEIRSRGVDYVVCFPHWGKEYTEVVTQNQKTMARELADFGYDLLVGSHSHVIQRYEQVNGKPVVYSIGNLISHLNNPKQKDPRLSVVCHLKLERDASGKVVPKIEFIPCRILKRVENVPYMVVPAIEGLILTKNAAVRMKEACRRAKEMLRDDDVVTQRFELCPEAFKVFEEMHDHQQSRLSALHKEQAPEQLEQDLAAAPAKGTKGKRPFVYKKGQGGLTLTDLDAHTSLVRLPAVVEGKLMTAIDIESKGNNDVRLVYIPYSVKTVGKNSFCDYTALESLRLYDGLLSIGEGAFARCVNMTGVKLPCSMREIKSRAFAGCGKLMTITVPPGVKSIADDAFDGCPKLTIYCEPGSYAEEYAKRRQIPCVTMPLFRKKELLMNKLTQIGRVFLRR